MIEHIDPQLTRAHAKNTTLRTALNISGEQFQRPMLHIQDKRMREEIIAAHYRAAMHFNGVHLPETLIARDSPHDFTFEDPDGKLMLLEITSFSDHSSNWTLVEAERRLMEALSRAGIANSSIAILPYGMSMRSITSIIHKVRDLPLIAGVDDTWLRERMAEASNTRQPSVFLLPDSAGKRLNLLFNKRRPLSELVVAAIEAKVAKGYAQAEEMVLIVDEQSMQHSQSDLNNAWDELIALSQCYPFREIYLYSGQYTNDDGRAAEFDLFPLKSAIDEHVRAVLERGPCQSFRFVPAHS